jgi:hypothetical protein
MNVQLTKRLRLGILLVLFIAGNLVCNASVRRRILVKSEPPGAKVFLNGKEIGQTPKEIKDQLFERKASDVEIRLELDDYETFKKTLTNAEAETNRNGFDLEAKLFQIRKPVAFSVDSNPPGALVRLDGELIGLTPLKTNVVFKRANDAAWPEHWLELEKERFDDGRTEGIPIAVITNLITAEMDGKGFTAEFKPAKFVQTPIRSFEPRGGKLELMESKGLSQVSSSEKVSLVTEADALMLVSRITVSPVVETQIAYSVPNSTTRENSKGKKISSGTKILLRTGSLTAAIVDQNFTDVDPFISPDGQWIYFSSDRERDGRHIYRISTQGAPAIAKITTGAFLDTEPAASPDGQSVAFTRRPLDAGAGAKAMIFIVGANGLLEQSVAPGRSPLWSPDGKQIVFVSDDDKIWTMFSNGQQRQQLTHESSRDLYPIWSRSGERIIFASDRANNSLRQPNFDIWAINVKGGEAKQITQDGSFETAPAVTFKGDSFLYFFSNRGGQKNGDETLQIYRTDLPPEFN